MPDRPTLSEQGKARRDAIRAHILDQTPALARNRRRNKQSFQALSITGLAIIITIPIVLRTPTQQTITTIPDPIPQNNSTTPVQITTLTTDPAILDRLSLKANSNPHTESITDEELLSTLESLGIQTGMIKTDTQTILTVDIAAAQSPITHTADSSRNDDTNSLSRSIPL